MIDVCWYFISSSRFLFGSFEGVSLIFTWFFHKCLNVSVPSSLPRLTEALSSWQVSSSSAGSPSCTSHVRALSPHPLALPAWTRPTWHFMNRRQQPWPLSSGCYVTLGSSLSPSVPQLPSLYNETGEGEDGDQAGPYGFKGPSQIMPLGPRGHKYRFVGS